ncbi:MAG: hypothetical protein AAGE84_13970 [Cyanobacteria bacterium P01_G01_bin.39]
MSSSKFDFLLVGVKEYLDSKQKYPYPDLLHHGMNTLSLEIKKSVSFPKTMQGFLKLLEEPVKDYCPPKWIPSEFDGDFGLLDMGSLSEEANDYIDEYLAEAISERDKVPESLATTIEKIIEIDNSTFIRLFNELKKAYHNDNPKKAQQEYLILRPFLIEYKYATGKDIKNTFKRTRYISAEEVGDLYEDCEEGRDYWYCDRCGILIERDGYLKGLKPRLCGNHHKNLSYVHRVEGQKDLRRVKEGVWRRVCFPGIPELNLYSALEKLKTEHPDYLKEVRLYPGVDCYDIQLRFSDDTVWAINFKDVQYPYRLAQKLEGLYREGSLRYNESFYVISDRCIDKYPNYLKILREEAKKLPPATQLSSDRNFRQRVRDKISELQKGIS